MQILLAIFFVLFFYLGVELFRLIGFNKLVASAWDSLEVLAKMRHKELKQLIHLLRQDKSIDSRILSTLDETSNSAFYACQAANPTSIGDAESGLRSNLAEVHGVLENLSQTQPDNGARELVRTIVILTNNITNAINGYNLASRNINDKLDKLPTSVLAPLVGSTYSQPISIKHAKHSGLFVDLS